MVLSDFITAILERDGKSDCLCKSSEMDAAHVGDGGEARGRGAMTHVSRGVARVTPYGCGECIAGVVCRHLGRDIYSILSLCCDHLQLCIILLILIQKPRPGPSQAGAGPYITALAWPDNIQSLSGRACLHNGARSDVLRRSQGC
jgi:hypothetical protein